MAIQSKCEKCGEAFLIITKEEEYYKEKDLALPKMCPECRYERRMSLRNRKKLMGYNCDNCKKDIITAIEPQEGLQIFCKECHEKWMQEHDCILGYSDAYKAQQGAGQSTPPEPKPSAASQEQPSQGSVDDPVSW